MQGSYVEDSEKAVSDLDRFTMAHVPPRSQLLWVHACSCILKTMVTLALLDRFSVWVLAQQLRAHRSAPSSDPAQRTVLVTHVPRGGNVAATFGEWYGEEAVERVTMVVQSQALAPLVAEKAALSGGLREASAAVAASPGGERPTRRVPPFSPCADRVDTVDFCTELLLECDARLAAARRAVLASPPGTAEAAGLLRRAAFVTFKRARTASVAAQVVHACDASTWRVAAAPEPGNVLWDNVGRYTASQALAFQIASWGATCAFCALYLIPAAAIQSLTFSENLVKFFPPIKSLLTNDTAQSLVEGVLPSVLLFVLAWIWPLFLRLFTVWQGAITYADVDRGMTAKSFLFNVLIAFVSTVLSGAVASGLREFVNNPANIPKLLAVKVPATSRFFMSYVIIQVRCVVRRMSSYARCDCLAQGVGAAGGMVARWWQALQYGMRSRTARTEDDKWPPFHQPFGRFYPRVLLQIQILVVFSTIAPLMQAVSLFFFLPAITIAKTKMFWHHEKAYEGYGRMWPLVRMCVVLILVLYQLTMAGLLGLKGGIYPAWVMGVSTIPLTLLYSRRMAGRYNPSMMGAVPVEMYAERDRKRRGDRLLSAAHAGHDVSSPQLPQLPNVASPSRAQGLRSAASAPSLPDLMLHPPKPMPVSATAERLPYLLPALADVDSSLAADDELVRRFGRAGLAEVVSSTVAMAGAGASYLSRAANGLLRRMPASMQPLARAVLGMLADRVDLHSGLEDDPDEYEAFGAPPPQSMTELRTNTANRTLTSLASTTHASLSLIDEILERNEAHGIEMHETQDSIMGGGQALGGYTLPTRPSLIDLDLPQSHPSP